ncbi:MAG TPA: hypothetical protein VNR62_00190, partial [Cellulomonas sp.]|nr:hypothetical protein [Cellulomonas sp.]
MDDATIAAHPQAPATALARIVSQRPDLRAIVAANPAVQPALLEWLAALHDPAVDAALASRSAQRVPVSSWTPEATPGAGWGPAAPAPATAFAQATYAGPATAVQDVTFQEEPRTRRRLWIGLVATAVVLVGGGALAAYLMVFSKLDGAPTPEAAVTQLVEGVAHKDGVAVYGSIAPSEIDGFGPLLSTSTGSADDEENRKKLLRVLDALDVDLTGLDVDVEPIGDGLAKVTFVGGTLSVDGDASEVVDALSDVYDPAMGGLEGLSGESTEQMWDEARAQVDEALPWSVDAADLTWQTEAGMQRPFLVAVHERGGWYVSPLMTLGEYVTVSSGGERGAMPTAAEQTGSATAEEAGSAFAGAVTDLLGGDATALAAALPPAEARFVSVYVSRWVADAHWSASSATVDEATFVPERIDDTRTRLTIGRIEIGGDSPATIEGTCVTDGASGQKLC